MFQNTLGLKRTIVGFILAISTCMTVQVMAQNPYFESYNNYSGSNFSIHGGVGTAILVGDIDDPKPQYGIPGKAFSANLGLSYRLTNWISIRGEANVFQLYSETKEGVWDSQGGVNIPSIKTFGTDITLSLIHNIIPQYQIDQGRASFNMYGLVGIGNVIFTPKDAETGENLREVNRNQVAGGYAKLAVVVPVGGGIEFYPSSYLSIGGELTYRYTYTDFLDDIKPLETANGGNDGYFLASFRVKYSLGQKGNGNLTGFNYRSYLKKSKRRAKYK